MESDGETQVPQWTADIMHERGGLTDLERLEVRLEPLVIPDEAVHQLRDFRFRERGVGQLGRLVKEACRRRVEEGLQREVAAEGMRDGVRDVQVAEAAFGNLVVVLGVAPAS